METEVGIDILDKRENELPQPSQGAVEYARKKYVSIVGKIINYESEHARTW